MTPTNHTRDTEKRPPRQPETAEMHGEEREPTKITAKRYRCTRCGHVQEQKTDHFGPTWSMGRCNTCPKCPPWAKCPEFGGQTRWKCIEEEAEKDQAGHMLNWTADRLAVLKKAYADAVERGTDKFNLKFEGEADVIELVTAFAGYLIESLDGKLQR